jgi:acetyl-CoA carboxylase biotin carboxyl carrier protein
MVGTFTRARRAKPFVEAGDGGGRPDHRVIEAMKLMNEIEADASGTIKAILVENGRPVEYGQALFIIG